MYKWMLFLTLGAAGGRVSGQVSIWNSRHSYLGQHLVEDTPRLFAADMLERGDSFALDRVAFSDDGREFYYSTNTAWFNIDHEKLRGYRFDGRRWRGPFVVFSRYYAPAFSPDGQHLYLEGGRRDTAHYIIWRSDRQPGGRWSQPAEYLIEPYGLYDFMPTASGVCYAGSNAHRGSLRDFDSYDICVLKMAGGDTTIASLGPPLNTPGFDGDFFVSRDESYIIISDKETKRFECELAISFHRADGSWTAPVSLGPLINDGVAHRWGEYVTPDGRFLFYTRGTSPKDCHLYWVRWDGLLARLRKEVLGG